MRAAGRAAASVLEMIGQHVQVGVTTDELNQICHDFHCGRARVYPCPPKLRWWRRSDALSQIHLHQRKSRGLPWHSLVPAKKLKNGDAINIDITVIKDGYHGDTSKMFFAGEAIGTGQSA